MAGGPIVIVPGEQGFADRDNARAHALDITLQNLLAAAQGQRRKVVLPGGQCIDPVVIAAHADHFLDAVIIRGDFLVAERPVRFDAVERALAEIRGGIAENDGVPVHGSPAQHPDAVDAHVIGLLVANGGANVAGVEEVLLFGAVAPVFEFVRPAVCPELVRFHLGARFEQDYLGAALAEFLRDNAAGGPGANHADVINRCGHRSVWVKIGLGKDRIG